MGPSSLGFTCLFFSWLVTCKAVGLTSWLIAQDLVLGVGAFKIFASLYVTSSFR